MTYAELSGVIAAVAVTSATYLIARRRRKQQEDRDLVESLIANKGARTCKDATGAPMDSVDWQLVNRAGAKRWAETLRAQRRIYGGIGRLVAFGEERRRG